ncbi:PREDICTED: uncharacterized protein LOC100637740 [Amphimedon queenslandica]|uniref:Uncharacterized protein n=1 Tax=Amphimedon queenslandica TaxID=400682 RepID=A0A1X7VTR0_AMPQE|nr:PREDICTED: uncharacterized protein LOC100637740 [Amphimedon queenslandica]|eukprot:XP_003382882.1 PREDICTED: uncharacterized protein LOC100637740 [Amphimedon queenslandica]
MSGENQPLTSPPGGQTIVITQPPTFVVYERRFGTGDHYLLLSIIISIVCFLFCGWLTLICTIPAILFALSAQDAESRGDNVTMEKKAKTALILDIAGMITGAVSFACFVIIVIFNS